MTRRVVDSQLSNLLRIALVALSCIAGAAAAIARQPARAVLTLYFLDAEGGQATLIVTPDNQSLLVDTGYGRDVARVVDAVREAGLSRIDRLLLTHFHVDHIGGAVALARQFPIGELFDHGNIDVPDDAEMRDTFEQYRHMRDQMPHSQPGVGTQLRLGDAELTWVSSDTHTLRRSLTPFGAANPACAQDAPEAEDPVENTRSTGFLLRFGRFRFLDVGDLTGPPLAALVCPANLLGMVDVYLLPHHGEDDGATPATLDALRPRAVVINNGPRKGARAGTLDLLHARSAITDVWQLHRATNPRVVNFADERIANLDTSTAHWIKVEAGKDGSFSVTNARTGEMTYYPSALGGPRAGAR